MKLPIMQSSQASCHFLPLGSKYSPQRPFLRYPQSVFFPSCKWWNFATLQHNRYKYTLIFKLLEEKGTRTLWTEWYQGFPGLAVLLI
jgi:hypothetical protein